MTGDNERIRAAATAEAPAHRRLLTSPRGGRILSAVMRGLFAVYTPRGHAVLVTTGRKSGKCRRIYIRAIRGEGLVHVVMLRLPNMAMKRPDYVSPWVLNLRADSRVRLRLGARVHRGIARELTDPSEIEKARDAFCDTVHLIDYGEHLAHKRGVPTRAGVKALHRYWFDTGIPLVITLDEAAITARTSAGSGPSDLR